MNREGLNKDGVLAIDKPAGMSSASLVSRVKRLSEAKKVGHTGTLDPFATGLMICCFNRATRLSRFFLHADKRYEAHIHLGIETDTQDLSGRITAEKTVPHLSAAEINAVLRTFTGPIKQAPPVYSALKHRGVPLYKLARQGRPVQKARRRVVIHEIRLLDVSLPVIQLDVRCSSGTYIRTLSEDVGKQLGCGGHLKQLRRTAYGGFDCGEAVALATLETIARQGRMSTVLIGKAAALRHMHSIEATAALREKIRQGKRLVENDFDPLAASAADPYVKIVDTGGRLLAVLEYKKAPRRYDYCCVFIQ